MRSAGVYLIVAIGLGLGLAATALYIMKPGDMPIAMPGSTQSESAMLPGDMRDETATPAQTPPVILRIGPASGDEVIHVVLSGLDEANKNAYRAARALQQSNPNLAINIVPAIEDGHPARPAFAWALAASDHPSEQESFIDGLMGTSGDVNSSVLTLLAQNNGLDAATLGAQATKPAINQALQQANNVIPPELPAIMVNGEWLTGDNVTSTAIGSALGQSAGQDQATRLVITDAYAYATAPSATMGAVFFTARNLGSQEAHIIGATTPVAGKVEIHENMNMDGMMHMEAKSDVALAAGATQAFAPDGLHLMLIDLPAPLAVGQKFPLTLILQGGSELSTFVTVTKPGEVLTNHAHSG